MHANSLQLCLTLCDPTDSSPPSSSVQGILQARILEWVAISLSNSHCMYPLYLRYYIKSIILHTQFSENSHIHGRHIYFLPTYIFRMPEGCLMFFLCHYGI